MARQAASRAPCLHLQKLQALRVCKPSPVQVLAVAVAALGFDYPHGRRPLDPHYISVASFRESHGLRLAGLRPKQHLGSCAAATGAQPQRAPLPAIGRSARARGSVRHDDLCRRSVRVPVPGPLHAQTPHSRPSSATTIHGTPSCSRQAAGPTGPIALAGLVSSLHASSSRPVPRGLCLWYHDYPNG